MCFDYCYSFCFSRKDGKALFSASCLLKKANDHVNFENAPMKEEEVSSLMTLIFESNLIEKAENFKKTKNDYHSLDETTYFLTFYFEAGSVFAEMRSEELEEFFFALAEKYV